MKRTLNQLEELQNQVNNIEFIKSYPILNNLFKSKLDKEIIELILSFNTNGKKFYMNYKNIASILGCNTQSVRNSMNKLQKLNYVIGENTSNYNGKDGGSSTANVVNMDLIIKTIKDGLSDDIEPTNTIIPEVKEDSLNTPNSKANDDDLISEKMITLINTVVDKSGKKVNDSGLIALYDHCIQIYSNDNSIDEETLQMSITEKLMIV